MRFMLDLETLSTHTNGLILEIGIVAFNLEGLQASRRVTLNFSEEQKAGADIDPETVKWWAEQSDEARAVIGRAEETKLPNRLLLEGLCGWVLQVLGREKIEGVYGKGADFDPVLLRSCFERYGLKPFWSYSKTRCYRTLMADVPIPEPKREGVHHDSVDDAAHQAKHAIEILRFLQPKPAPPK